MTLSEMIGDFCRRNGNRYTPKEVAEYGSQNLPYFDEDGFFVLSYDNGTLRVDFLYVIPGRPKSVVKEYIRRIEEMAEKSGCRYIQYATRRGRGLHRMFPQAKPVGTIYEKEVVPHG